MPNLPAHDRFVTYFERDSKGGEEHHYHFLSPRDYQELQADVITLPDEALAEELALWEPRQRTTGQNHLIATTLFAEYEHRQGRPSPQRPPT